MNASEWVVQCCYMSRREGRIQGLIVGVIVGLGVMLGAHLALSMHSDRVHESAVASIREADALLLRTCRADVARYNDIAEVEKAYAAREAGR